ncbi:MAG: hypothetical protein FWF67_06160 [Fibromonadales bacterium]|nr:hypothetical protein [Fibromonadales bacterium]
MKFNLYLTSLAAVLCTSLFFSCTTNIEFPPPPAGWSSYSSSSSSLDAGGSSSSDRTSTSSSSRASSSSSSRASSSSYFSPSSSSVATSLPSSSSGLSSGDEFCQIGASCVELDKATCDLMSGTVVSACILTCDISPSAIYFKNYSENPKPVVRCNNIVVSSAMDWTPSDLYFTNTGSYTISVKAANCNQQTKVCGTITVFD